MIETFRKILRFGKKRKSSFIKSLIFSFIRSAFAVSEFLAIITAVKVLTGEAEAKPAVIKIIILTLICIAGNFITSYIEQTNTLFTSFYMTADNRVEAGGILRKLPLGFFNSFSSGRITAALTTTLSGVESAAAMVMTGIISGLFNSLALFIFMMFYDWRTGLLTGAGMIIYLLVVNLQMKISRKNAPELQEAQSSLAAAALTFLQGIKVTKAYSLKDGDKGLKAAIEDSRKENIALTDASMPSQFAAGLTVAVSESAILALSLVLMFITGSISPAKTVILIIFSFMVFAALNQAGSMLSMIGLLDSGLSEVEEIENTPGLSPAEPVKYPKSDEIEFDHVSFSYGENEVLRDISLKMKPGTLTAIIGPSGSGKTTLCQLIPRFRDVTSGCVKLGGADVRNIPYEELMKKISMVFQNVYLFEDTVMNNIRFGVPDADEEQVIEAAKKACCHDFITALPDGYNTVLTEGGSSLSGGEKQRISIARAILKDSPVIILDEATSALDAENEYEILSAIEKLTENKTVIMIAHRIKTVEKADCIAALKDGKIVQTGTHEELSAVDGLYKDFINARKSAASWKISS